jgi:predicted nucleic acid-binding protein
MCIILDANCLGLFTSADSRMVPITAYFRNNGGIAIGGTKLKAEYKNNGKFIRFLAELARQGQVFKVSDAVVDEKANQIASSSSPKSDDPHILAIAALSNARILVSHDQPLHQDFTSTNFFIPKGKVYQNQTHKKLLSKLQKCALV